MKTLFLWYFLYYNPLRRPVLEQSLSFEQPAQCEEMRLKMESYLDNIHRTDWWISPVCELKKVSRG